MTKSARLSELVTLLQDGRTHQAEHLAERFGVSPRTIYRDLDRLRQTGAPVQGKPGTGYQASAELTLPALNLTGDELEALHLALSVLQDAGDEAQKASAQSLSRKLDTALQQGDPFSAPLIPAPDLQRHLSRIRQAIAAQQKLRVASKDRSAIIRPLRLDYFGRIWCCICWNETTKDFSSIPLDSLRQLTVLPSLFIDEPGKTLRDYLTQ